MKGAFRIVLLQALMLSLVGCGQKQPQGEGDRGMGEETVETICMADERFNEIASVTNALAPGVKLEDALTQFGQLSESLRVTTLRGKKRSGDRVSTSVKFSRCSCYLYGFWHSDIEGVMIFFDRDGILDGVVSDSKFVPSWGKTADILATMPTVPKRDSCP